MTFQAKTAEQIAKETAQGDLAPVGLNDFCLTGVRQTTYQGEDVVYFDFVCDVGDDLGRKYSMRLPFDSGNEKKTWIKINRIAEVADCPSLVSGDAPTLRHWVASIPLQKIRVGFKLNTRYIVEEEWYDEVPPDAEGLDIKAVTVLDAPLGKMSEIVMTAIQPVLEPSTLFAQNIDFSPDDDLPF